MGVPAHGFTALRAATDTGETPVLLSEPLKSYLRPNHATLVAKLEMGILPRMIQTVEAVVDERGIVRLLEPVRLDRRHRALVTILTDEPSDLLETAVLSEASLAEDWNRPEEDAAWLHLQQVR